MAAEVEQLRSGETPEIPLSEERRRSLGLAPSAAATYSRTTEGVSFAGYGEMLLENFNSENESGAGNAPTTRLDFLRAILYAGYRFNDRFLFNSEIEVEHANEIWVEFAYLDYLVNDNLTVRGGMLLLPLGLINEYHEPTVFLGAKRPDTEQRILPDHMARERRRRPRIGRHRQLPRLRHERTAGSRLHVGRSARWPATGLERPGGEARLLRPARCDPGSRHFRGPWTV